ncbi:hypothetical protein LTR17_005910 [Elasticomyces elasticus]|nr:hypothetical protein LTR17_005910 [Elasticomyces elasticus]
MAQQAEASISGLREQIKDNAVLLFPNQVESYQTGNNQLSGAGAFTIVVAKAIRPPVFAHTPLYVAHVAYHDREAQCFRRAANGVKMGSVVEALQSLLDVTALAITADGENRMVPDEDARWMGYGGGTVMAADGGSDDGYSSDRFAY